MPPRTWSYTRFIFIAAAVTLMFVSPADSQNQQQQAGKKKIPKLNSVEMRGSGRELRPDVTNTIRVDVPLVLLNVTVTDPYGRVVTGLEREHFRVLENKQPQEITHFSSEDVPISIGVIIDVSGSMSNKYDKARQAAVRFMRTANPQDEFLLVSFSEHAQLVSHFTGDIETLQSRLLYTKPPKGRTALLDAVYLALSQMHSAQH
ncbi:MAG: VWA domain-containing protein, partial [Candidatus Acidiferrales bacterium]